MTTSFFHKRQNHKGIFHLTRRLRYIVLKFLPEQLEMSAKISRYFFRKFKMFLPKTKFFFHPYFD